ncbi:MAG: sensor domain-containing diguanylate cyclase [Halieaceae bacterium]
MMEPATPAGEAQRLDALLQLKILDTAAEERFDRITRIAQKLFDVPIALVSLVDSNRQWIKSSCGLDAGETSRDISFCGHAILSDEVFIVPDASADERFADNPLVTEAPHIRFYAGCPLQALDGSRVGTLCIIDRVARELDDSDIKALQDLASMVENELAAVHMAILDELTGLASRRGFMCLAQKNLNIGKRTGMSSVVAYFDIDNFKKINEQLGHDAGDAALTFFASEMESVFRESDILGRLGGDEFVALMSNTTLVDAQLVVDRLQQRLQVHQESDALGFELQFSYGFAETTGAEMDSIANMLSRADLIMYEDKRNAAKSATGT